MKRHCMAMAVSVLALAAAPSTALAGGGGLLGGLVQQTQTATNSNETNQTANSTATSEQTNVNAPISIMQLGRERWQRQPVEQRQNELLGAEQQRHRTEQLAEPARLRKRFGRRQRRLEGRAESDR